MSWSHAQNLVREEARTAFVCSLHFCTDETLTSVCFEMVTSVHPLRTKATWNDYTWLETADNIRRNATPALTPSPALAGCGWKAHFSPCLNVGRFWGLFSFFSSHVAPCGRKVEGFERQFLSWVLHVFLCMKLLESFYFVQVFYALFL